MTYTIQLPSNRPDRPGGRLDIVDGVASAVQRQLRRAGLAGYEPRTTAALLAVFESLPRGFCFYDVGANVGLYAAMCASMFEPGEVVAFEPTPDTADHADAIVRANRLEVRVERLALADRAGMSRLFLSATSDASNSLVEGFKQSTGTVDVRLDTLDRYVAATGRPPDVVKIDTETYEPEVLAGGRATIARHRPVLVVEALRRRGRDHGEDLMAAMEGLGYTYYPLDRARSLAPRQAIRGSRAPDQDWLLAPEPLTPELLARVEAWTDAVAACTPMTNEKLSLAATLRSVYQAQGLAGVASGVRNRVRAGLSRGARTP